MTDYEVTETETKHFYKTKVVDSYGRVVWEEKRRKIADELDIQAAVLAHGTSKSQDEVREHFDNLDDFDADAFMEAALEEIEGSDDTPAEILKEVGFPGFGDDDDD